MLQTMASLSRTMPTWSAYERGIESLMNSLIPQDGGALGSKKGLTFADLLIKVWSPKAQLSTQLTHGNNSLYSEFADIHFYSPSYTNTL